MWIIDFAIRKLPIKFVLWLVRGKFGKRDLNTFIRFLSSDSWKKVSHDPEKWIFEEDNYFVIEEDRDSVDFKEEWTKAFPDKTARVKDVYLKVGGEDS